MPAQAGAPYPRLPSRPADLTAAEQGITRLSCVNGSAHQNQERATLDIPENGDQVMFGDNASPPKTWPFHVLLSVPLAPEQIEAIGAREGWRAKTFGRGMRGRKPFFHVIEFWLENRELPCP